MLVSKYPKNQLKTSKTDPGNPYAVRHRLYVIYQFQNTLGISWKPRNWTENLNTVSNTLRMSWNAWNRETGIPCSPTQTGCDFLFSKYADDQLKTEFLSKNDLTKWYDSKKHNLESDVEHWWTGTGGPALDVPVMSRLILWARPGRSLLQTDEISILWATIPGNSRWIAYYLGVVCEFTATLAKISHSSISLEITGASLMHF